jgi:hypothetical protein
MRDRSKILNSHRLSNNLRPWIADDASRVCID